MVLLSFRVIDGTELICLTSWRFRRCDCCCACPSVRRNKHGLENHFARLVTDVGSAPGLSGFSELFAQVHEGVVE
jgi:hypothetical protein